MINDHDLTFTIRSFKPTCYWITGLSGSGKTTIGSKLSKFFNASGQPSIFLDGDELRKIYAQKAVDHDTRVELGYRNFRLCQSLIEQGFNVVLSAIGMHQEIYDYSKSAISSCCLIYLDVPLCELMRRDPKGIYAAAANGGMTNVAGLDLVIDTPIPDVHLPWFEGLMPDDTMKILLNSMNAKSFITIAP